MVKAIDSITTVVGVLPSSLSIAGAAGKLTTTCNDSYSLRAAYTTSGSEGVLERMGTLGRICKGVGMDNKNKINWRRQREIESVEIGTTAILRALYLDERVLQSHRYAWTPFQRGKR